MVVDETGLPHTGSNQGHRRTIDLLDRFEGDSVGHHRVLDFVDCRFGQYAAHPLFDRRSVNFP